jgi:hypothetical protein
MARMFLGKAVSNIQTTVDEQASELRAELERATQTLAIALVVVAALATFAVVYAIAGGKYE